MQLPAWHEAAGIAAAFGMSPEHDAGAPHTVPFTAAVLHRPPWQVSTVQGLLSMVQTTPFPRFTWAQPVAATQESVVQLLPSLHGSGAPAWHTPLRH